MEKVVIIGGGPAGLTAAIYASRALLNPILYEGFMAEGVPAGGQLMTTTHIENRPGFADPILAPDLMRNMRQQAINAGTRIVTKTIKRVDLSKRPFKIEIGNDIVETETLIIATGASAKWLGCKGEKEYRQKGISACAVCDGALPMFRNKQIIIVGGGDTAAEEATFMTKYASKVILCVRSDKMRASKAMQEKVFANDKIQILRNTEVIEALGNSEIIQQVKILDNLTGKESLIDAGGMFYAIGHTPATKFLDATDGSLAIDENGYIITKSHSAKTSIPGLFAAGDVQDHHYRQAITSAGSGCMAAMDAEKFLGGEAW